MNLHRFGNSALVAAFCLSLCTSASAAIMYGNASDIPPGVITYTNVTESSSTDPVPPPRFGAPDVVVNTLDFDPVSFGANSTSGGADITDVQLNFGIKMLPGTGITSLLIAEGGDFSLNGAGTSATQVIASILARVTIQAVDGVMLATPITVLGNSSVDFDLTSNPGASFWDNGLLLEFGPALVSAGIPFVSGVTMAEVVIDDQLIAISQPTSIAFIAKKDFVITPGGDLETNEIPEPTSALVGVLALAGFAACRRTVC